jgi:hypothetical protein
MGATLAGLTAPAWLLALLAGVSAKALIETVRPQPLNPGEDEFARQKKYGLAPKDEDKGVRAAARNLRKKIMAPAEDEASVAARKGMATPISYGGGFEAESFRKEDAAERAILKGTYEGTKQGILDAFRIWVQERRQGYGDAGVTEAAYHPGASGGMGGGSSGGAGSPEGSPSPSEKPSEGRTPLPNIVHPPAATTPHAQTPNQGATPRVQAPATTSPAAPIAPRGTTPQARRSEPSEAAAARSMKEFAEAGGFAGQPGQYRPQYNLGAKDLSDAVVNKIAGEAHVNDQKSVDAVIHNMLNRVGTKAYGPSGNLQEVALAAGQYAGHGHPSGKQAEYIRSRIRAIASGAVPDITNGSNEYRAAWYRGPWGRKHANSPVIGGNRFAFNPKGGIGPYGPRKPEEAAARAQSPANAHAPAGMNEWIARQRGDHPDQAARAPKHAPSQAFWMERGGQAVANHAFLVGEKGPELFVPRQSGEVIPHHANFANLRSKLAGYSGNALGGILGQIRELLSHDGAREHFRSLFDRPQRNAAPLNADLGRYIANTVGITSQAHKVTGDASLRIDLHGFPKGTKTKSQINGLFKSLTMYRGLAAPMADQEG